MQQGTRIALDGRWHVAPICNSGEKPLSTVHGHAQCLVSQEVNVTRQGPPALGNGFLRIRPS